jgi:pilus assembly protein CpaC
MLFRRCVLAAGLFAAAGVLLCNVSFALAQDEAQPIQISGGSGQVTRSIVLWLGKAAIVELPVEAKDVLVANPEIVDAVVRTPTRTYLLGQKVGTTNAFFFDAAGKQILNVEIRVERDVSPIEATIKRYLPKARVKIESVNDSIVLTGTVPSAADADKARSIAVRFIGDDKRVFSMITIAGGEQVLLRVRVAEMQRTIAKQLGINMDSLFDLGEVALDLNTTNPFSILGRSLTDAISSVTYSRRAGENGNNVNADSVETAFQALERHGLLRTLAEPNLTAISGESAKFLAGGEFPVPKSRDRDGNVTIEFKPFGVGLAFTPVVLSEGRISLRISTEVSELQQQGSFVAPSSFITDPTTNELIEIKGLTIPALRVRRAATTVELPSGGSLVMAGLLQQASKQDINALPGVKELPVIGALFQSRDFQNDETELVVMVTPYLVGAVKEKDIRLPTDGFAHPTDFETIFLGRLNAVYGKSNKSPSARRLEGPIGFILE